MVDPMTLMAGASLVSSFFGGGSKSNSPTVIDPRQTYTGQDRDTIRQINNRAETGLKLSDSVGQGYQGAKVAGYGNDTQQALARMRMFGDAADKTLYAPALDSYKRALTASDVNNNPALQGAITAAQRPTIEAFTGAGGVLNNIRDAGTGAGQFSGSRAGVAEGIAGGKLAQSLNDTASQMTNQGYMAGLNAEAAARTQGGAMADLGQVGLNAQGAVGLAEDTLKQNKLNYDAQAAQFLQSGGNWDALSNYMATAGQLVGKNPLY